MKKLRKIFGVVLTSLLVLSALPNSSMASTDVLTTSNSPIKECNIQDYLSKADEKQVQINEDGSKTIKITDPETLKEIESQIGKKYPDKQLREIEVKVPSETEKRASVNQVSPQALIALERTGTRQACGSDPLRRSSGTGTIKMTVSESVTTEVRSGWGVDLKKINASFGKSIGETMKVSDTTSYTPPKGKLGVLEAYANYDIIDFNVKVSGIKAGTGSVMYGVGVCWYKYY